MVGEGKGMLLRGVKLGRGIVPEEGTPLLLPLGFREGWQVVTL